MRTRDTLLLTLLWASSHGMAEPYDVLLGRPADTSITVSVLASTNLDIQVEYGMTSGVYALQSPILSAAANTPLEIALEPLVPGTRYFYRLKHRTPGESLFDAGEERTFHTQRPRDETFTFVVEADLHHLDNNLDVYRAAASNMLADSPDFMINLGDTFMTEKWGVDTYTGAVALVEGVRSGFHSLLGHSVPILLIPGNHEAELGWLLEPGSPQENIAVWSTRARQAYYPCPEPGTFCSGSATDDPYLLEPRDGYYAFEWGDALFVTLDPFWYTPTRPGRSGDGWDFTLGREQIDWLETTLAGSDAAFKFVFIHNLVGGDFEGSGRGGKEFAPYFEWGGHNTNGTWGFDIQRPGWPATIERILFSNGVDVVFHGHDHLFGRQDRDVDGDGRTDMVYLVCPQPAGDYSGARHAADYGYLSGDFLSNSGHIRGNVSSSNTTIEYVRAYAAADENDKRVNGSVDYSFTIPAVPDYPGPFTGTIVLGRPTDRSLALNVLSMDQDLDVSVEYGTAPGVYTEHTERAALQATVPLEVELTNLQPNTRYHYRLRYSKPGGNDVVAGAAHTFHTARPAGSTFTFCIQGDSHPERGSEFDSDLYAVTLNQAASDNPDFYLTIGDDFSVDTLKSNEVNEANVAERYLIQRPYLGLVGHSAPLFLVNGNHEQAARYLLDGTPNNVAVWAQNARNRYYPQPAPDAFYTGNTEPVEYIGLLRNTFAWTWGDALFVTIDPYWSSPVPVDNVFGGGPKATNKWDITLGDTQYNWLKQTLEESSARFKFVFAHHIHGTGRGGTDQAHLYEWGGYDDKGRWQFDAERPGWAMPIHDLMATNGVTIFFQGHDHIFCRQELDGVIYQTLPEPGDPNYALHNADAFDSDVKLPNTGYTRVTVSPDEVQVDYVRTYLPADETPVHPSGEVAYSYAVPLVSGPPVITNVTRGPAQPTEDSDVWVTATVTDNVAVAGVTLTYEVGSNVEATVFNETMRTAQVKPWTGDGCDHVWTVTASAANHVEQRTNANHGAGNPCGCVMRIGTSNPTDTMIATTDGIDARGDEGIVEFWLEAGGLEDADGWTFQLDAGTGYVTRLSELTGANHAWQHYEYELLPAERVNSLRMRFQFRGGENGDRVRLDQISVTTRSGGAAASVAMHDDGAHCDGDPNDNVYGASIPVQPAGTCVSYHITATDSDGLVTTALVGAPTTRNTYTVQPALPLRITEVALDHEESRLRFTWHSVPGRAYDLQMTTTLLPPDWRTLATNMPGNIPELTTTWTLPLATTNLRAFYRVSEH